ncbi:MAG: hypothetical protein HZC36_05720 [Armatimonadetes bacterium]|nr:hypothetical protein [Armatimonadota bacterium]
MLEISYVEPSALDRYVNSDGQRFTTLIRKWAGVYLPRIGITGTEWSISGESFRADGGVDGLINAASIADSTGYLAARTVFQFKAGDTKVANAKEELTKAPKKGQPRIRDLIAEGYRLVWVVARGRTDIEIKEFEDALHEIVKEIKSDAPKPVLLDSNRLATCLSQTPVIAAEIVGPSGMFISSDIALKEKPHSLLPNYVAPSYFAALKSDVEGFIASPDPTESLLFFAGEPGIGKSRAILEVVESIPELKGCACYFRNPLNASTFFNLASQYKFRGVCVIDEYAADPSLQIDKNTVPNGLKVILIGHSFKHVRTARERSGPLRPLTDDESERVFSTAFPALLPASRSVAIKYARGNLRLTNWLCDAIRKRPNPDLTSEDLDREVSNELDKDSSAKQAIKRLALVPMLLSEDVDEFCGITGIDASAFRAKCRSSWSTSGFVHFSENVLYVSGPAIAQVALIRFWTEEPDEVKRILAAPGKFFEAMLQAVNRLAPGPEKEAMLLFFSLPQSDFGLANLVDARSGRHFLQLLTADPDTYLPQLHRIIQDNLSQLESLPYETRGVGRRDIIWKVRDLAQFEEYFEQAEEIVHWFALKEVPSPYANVASSYWVDWFWPYFDFTEYPYEKRLDLLGARIESGQDDEHRLVLSALASPFPHSSSNLPSPIVGGRAAPPSLQFIHHRQIALAAQRIPDLLCSLLNKGSVAVRAEVGKAMEKSRFSWLERLNTIEPYLKVISHPLFPQDSLREIVVDARHYLSITSSDKDQRKSRMHAMSKELLERIDQSDPIVDALMLAEHGYYRKDQEPAIEKVQTRVLKRCREDAEFLGQVIALLNDPAKHGGWRLGVKLGAVVEKSVLDQVLGRLKESGPSPFALGMIGGYLGRHQDETDHVLGSVRETEATNPHWSLSVYQAIGDEVYLHESARMLNTTDVSSGLFGLLWREIKLPLEGAAAEFVEAIRLRLQNGDAEAVGPALSVVNYLKNAPASHEAFDEFALLAFRTEPPDRRSTQDEYEWQEVAEWLLPVYPKEIILLCAAMEQSEFSAATAVLKVAAADHPEEVLDALVPKLADPYSPPFLFHGSVTMILELIEDGAFKTWLSKQEFRVAMTIAGNLPKPYLDGSGQARVPLVTRAFWEVFPPSAPDFDKLQGEFRAQTFSTGVYWGHGVELFSDRIKVACQLKNDPNPAIRDWAAGFEKESQAMLRDAKRAEDLDSAQQDIGD